MAIESTELLPSLRLGFRYQLYRHGEEDRLYCSVGETSLLGLSYVLARAVHAVGEGDAGGAYYISLLRDPYHGSGGSLPQRYIVSAAIANGLSLPRSVPLHPKPNESGELIDPPAYEIVVYDRDMAPVALRKAHADRKRQTEVSVALTPADGLQVYQTIAEFVPEWPL